jgi:pilus retraction protein PilT
MASLLQDLLGNMDTWKASDLFLSEGRPPAVRVHGKVRQVRYPPTSRDEMTSLLDEVAPPAARKRLEDTGDVDLGYAMEDGRRFRLNLSRQRGVISLVARAIPGGELKFEELGLPAGAARLAEFRRGLTLITGATGSGKSTTVAAMLHHINRHRAAHIVTIEDPIEFVHRDIRSRVTQREVGTDTASFNEALRRVVRQSPDVIVIGEMRDRDSVAVAINAALTGHLVIASLHTIDTTQTLQRILSFYPEHLRSQVSVDLSLCLRGVLSQRLLPRADGSGRVLALEMMTVGPGASRLIRDQRVEELADLMKASESEGVKTFNQSLLELYQAGEISLEVGRAYATNPDEFELNTQGMTTGVAGFKSKEGPGELAGLDIKSLLTIVREQNASDLHLTVGRPPILRISGKLTPMATRPLSEADMRTLLYSILGARQRSIYELEQELDFALAMDDGQRFRINAYFQKGRMAAALRAIPNQVPDAEELGLPQPLIDLAGRAHGLLLVCGPTGSGKSTTLACLVDRINRTRPCRIITIEDPIEYTHQSIKATVDQREVHADTQSFAGALRFILRQDPDVILVGEMRDLETVSAVLTAAETGHLVLATLHSNDAIQTIDRVVDVFPAHQQRQARSQLAASLLGVVSQRLLSRKDGPGRVPAFEVMVANPAIRNLIRENKMHQARSIMEGGRMGGMVTMDKALQDLYEAGTISHRDAMRFIQNPKVLGGSPDEAY